MKKFCTALAALAFSFLTQAAHAEVISLGSLSYSTNANPAAQWNFASPAQNDIFIEFTVSYTGALQNNDFAVFYFGNSTGPNIGMKANCDGACTNDLFVRMGGAGWSPFNYINPLDAQPEPASYHLFGRLSKTGSSGNYNRFDLWFNPTAAEKASLTGWDAYATGNSGYSSFSSFGIRTANLDAGDTVNFNDVTINAVPEPGTVSLLGLAFVGMAAMRRRRARPAA